MDDGYGFVGFRRVDEVMMNSRLDGFIIILELDLEYFIDTFYIIIIIRCRIKDTFM